jgi:O-antigen ligase
LTLFWAWLALGLLWSRVPYVSMVNFWWVGSFTFVYWLLNLARNPEDCWHWSARAVFLVGLVLAVTGLYQLLVLNGDPKSTFLSRNSHAAVLILISIPASAYFLQLESRRRLAICAALLFAFFLGIAVTGSRGVMLSLLLAASVLAAVAYRRVPTRRLVAWLAIILGAYLLANFLLQGWLGGRLGSVLEPSSAGHDRFLIWRQAWKMVTENPWLGVGLGTYWLFWPPYRHPADSSAGFYVHNDYLQLWIETGIVGLALLLAVYAMLAWLFVRALHNPRMSARERIEASGLFAGLLAVAAHSFFDFNLYILPILIVAGLALGRLHGLCLPYVVESSASVPATARRTRFMVSGLAALLLVYFGALAASAWLTERARVLAEEGELREADHALTWAGRLAPGLDVPLVMHAGLLTRVLDQLPEDFPPDSRRAVFEDALALLEDAERANAYRANIYYARARLLHTHAPKVAPTLSDGAPVAYRMSLARDPRFHWARVGLAEWLLARGETRAAHELLEQGIAHWYPPTRDTAVYFAFAARLRRAQGEEQGARELEQRVRDMAQAHGANAEQILTGAPGISGAPPPLR